MLPVVEGQPQTVTLDVRSRAGGPLTVTITYAYADADGRPECIELAVASPSGRPISTTTLRALRPGKLIETGRRELLKGSAQAPFDPDQVERVEKAMAARPGRPPRWTAADLARVAEVYSHAWQSGGKALHEVAKAMKLRDAKAASRLVARSRKEGFLSPTTRGKRSGPILSEVTIRAEVPVS